MGTPPAPLSISAVARPSQPVLSVRRGSADCQTSMASKCELLGIRIADPLDDRQLPLLPHRPQALIPGCRPDVVVQANHRISGLAQCGTSLVVQVVGVGNDRIEAVIAAAHLEHDQDLILARGGGPCGAGHELGTIAFRAINDEPFRGVRVKNCRRFTCRNVLK